MTLRHFCQILSPLPEIFFVYAKHRCAIHFFDYAPIIIEDGVSFGYQNIVITSTHKLSNFNEIEARQVIIEANAPITCRVIILGGVTIGANSVIGSGSVVTRDIPPNVFATGNPYKPIQYILSNQYDPQTKTT